MGEAYLVHRNINVQVVRTSGLPEFTYTGSYSTIDDGTAENPNDWRIKFLTSGTLTFTKLDTSIDLFIVGGGGGAAYCPGGSMCWSLGAGGGGYTKTCTKIVPELNTPYTITIGGGGSAGYSYNGSGGGNGGTSSAFGYSAGGGNGGLYKQGGNGGSGGGAFSGKGGSDGSNGEAGGQGGTGGTGQHTTTREFGEASGDLYATGGSTTFDKTGGANTGDGGSAYGNYGGEEANGLPGGSGIVIIRNAR